KSKIGRLACRIVACDSRCVFNATQTAVKPATAAAIVPSAAKKFTTSVNVGAADNSSTSSPNVGQFILQGMQRNCRVADAGRPRPEFTLSRFTVWTFFPCFAQKS